MTHPAERAIALLSEGGDADDLAALIREYFGRPDLKETLQALLRLAFVYDRRGDQTASRALIDAVQTARTAFEAADPVMPPRKDPVVVPEAPRRSESLLAVRAGRRTG